MQTNLSWVYIKALFIFSLLINSGTTNKAELTALRKALRTWKADVVYINEEISAKSLFYVEQHYLSHSIHLADALIGATSVVAGLPLLTANDRHYKAIKEIEIRKFRP